MGLILTILRILIIIAAVLLMACPFWLEYRTFRRDNEKKITYKRFRVAVYTFIYAVVVTVLLYLMKSLLSWIGSLSFVNWLASKIALSSRLVYFIDVAAVIIVNAAIGFLYFIISKFVRIGLKKKNLTKPKKKNGEFTWRQKAERLVIRFFHSETWFFVGSILKYLSIFLSAAYALVFVIYQIPAMFGAGWIPFDFIKMVFDSGYIYPTITLLVLWEGYFFLEGIRLLEKECPELLKEDAGEVKSAAVDLDGIDKEIHKQFRDYYVCDLELSSALTEKVSKTSHESGTAFIGDAVENDRRNPQARKEIYLDSVDALMRSEKSLLINGGFFTEFSMYFLRCLSIIIARGDNVCFVCNNDAQIDSVYEYLNQAFSEMTSLYCKDFGSDAVDFDDPIWRIVKISGEYDTIDESSVDDGSILVTTLGYLCSNRFETEHSSFINLLDTIVFVDTLKTVNTYNRQLAMFNTRLRHITKTHALQSKNGTINKSFRVRYMSRPVRYICFDDTKTPGLDKVLKNLLASDFTSVDAMNYNPTTIVRLYNYEPRTDDNGRYVCPQYLDADEEIGAIMNMAVLCLAKGASNVTIFADDAIPYSNIAESIASNSGRLSISADGNNLRLNKPFYNPDSYSVILAVDSCNNLPAALRRYISMAGDKPTLVIVFSKPYMLRDYFAGVIDSVWSSTQVARIPVEEGTRRDVAQKILVKASAGGISEKEILDLASDVFRTADGKPNTDVSSILRSVLKIYVSPDERIDLYNYFEYSSSHDFDENGIYDPIDKVMLRRQGTLYDIINGRDMVTMLAGDREITLPLPKSRLTQNYIAGQNLLYGGNIYYIERIDTESGVIYARLAVGGLNDEAYTYVQSREYRIDPDPEQIEYVFPSKQVILSREDGDVSVDEVNLSVFRAPMEVVTNGYYEVDPHTFTINLGRSEYHCINDANGFELARQTYRRYGRLENQAYSSESVMGSTHFLSSERPALMMTVRISGQFGGNVNRMMALAAVMLNELLKSMFPSVADSVAVCPLLQEEFGDEESKAVLGTQPRLLVAGEHELFPRTDFELVIIEDCASDLGVVSVLMSAGNDILNTLFEPIFRYLRWYSEADPKSEYLYYGLGHEPACFDFESLRKLSGLVGDDKHDLRFVDIGSVTEYERCDFCGRRYSKGDDVVELEDGRKMCKSCASNLVGNDKKALRSHLERAKIFLESTYGITLDDEYEFCFESTTKISNTLKQNRSLKRRGADAPLISYIDDKKKVHVEYSIPSVNLSELLVRELTHVWQLKHVPTIDDELAEGHIALVAIQYLRFLNQYSLASVRTNYYESTSNDSGAGYRRIIRELLAHPEYNNNPFRYLIEISGSHVEDDVTPPTPRVIEDSDLGRKYEPENPDRALDGNIRYFYFERLTASMQAAYNVFLEAIRNHEEMAEVSTDFSLDEIKRISESIQYDHPELFWYKTVAMSGRKIFFYYGATAEEAAVLQKHIDEVVPKYLEGIDDSMSAYDVALRLHVKVIASVDYDTIALHRQEQEGGPAIDKIDYLRTICGVLLNGKAVCEGYARTMQYLLQKCGIECAELAGYIHKENGEGGGAHAWNIVKIDGDYYQLDTTWDDSSNTVQTVKSNDFGFDYFCITTEEMKRTRDIDLCPTDVPICSATRANYYNHNDLVINSYDFDKLASLARDAAAAGRKFFTFKCATKALFDQVHDQLYVSQNGLGELLKAASKADKRISAGTYARDTNILTMTVRFKYK